MRMPPVLREHAHGCVGIEANKDALVAWLIILIPCAWYGEREKIKRRLLHLVAVNQRDFLRFLKAPRSRGTGSVE